LDEDAAELENLPIYIAATGTLKGRGAYASRNLVKGEFIGEYTGQILCEDQVDGTPRVTSEYLFDLGEGFVVDAERMGNKIRRLNHSDSSPNVSSIVVNHHGVRKVCMYAKCDIPKDAELTFNYGKGFKNRFSVA
jgi:SET domain-containing protein